MADDKTFRFIARDGSFNVVRRNAPRAYWNDLYHWLVDIKWRYFIALLALVYFGANAIFALLYMSGGDCIHGARPGSFADAFFFSIQSSSTIGYGAMYPKTTWANTLVALESFTGLLITAVSTGLVFAKFARPTARVAFSDKALITDFDGAPTLMFRMANMRGNQLVGATLTVMFARFERTIEGEELRRFYELDLQRDRTSMFVLSWTAFHTIDEDSPLFGYTPAQWREDTAEVVVSLSGIDGTFSQNVHARHSYTIDDIVHDAHFVDVITVLDDGRVQLDYSRLHDIT